MRDKYSKGVPTQLSIEGMANISLLNLAFPDSIADFSSALIRE